MCLTEEFFLNDERGIGGMVKAAYGKMIPWDR